MLLRTRLAATMVVGMTAACAIVGCSNDDSAAQQVTPEDGGSGANARTIVDATVGDGGNPTSDAFGDSSAADGADGDAPVDAIGDGTDGGPSDGGSGNDALGDDAPDGDGDDGTLAIILATQGAACQACAEQACVDAGTACEHLAGQVADAGPKIGLGQSREELCYATLSCVLNETTACYDQGNAAMACYCGAQNQDCGDAGPDPDAPCLTQEEEGLETTDSTIGLQRLYDTSFGAGTANAILFCLGVTCGISCEP